MISVVTVYVPFNSFLKADALLTLTLTPPSHTSYAVLHKEKVYVKISMAHSTSLNWSCPTFDRTDLTIPVLVLTRTQLYVSSPSYIAALSLSTPSSTLLLPSDILASNPPIRFTLFTRSDIRTRRRISTLTRTASPIRTRQRTRDLVRS